MKTANNNTLACICTRARAHAPHTRANRHPFLALNAALLLAAVTVGTWNGEWFPSGRAEHRAAPEIEEGAIRAAGRMLRAGLAQADPAGTNDLVLCFNEFRRDTDGASVAARLCQEVGRTNLHVAVVSGYRRRDRFWPP